MRPCSALADRFGAPLPFLQGSAGWEFFTRPQKIWGLESTLDMGLTILLLANISSRYFLRTLSSNSDSGYIGPNVGVMPSVRFRAGQGRGENFVLEMRISGIS